MEEDNPYEDLSFAVVRRKLCRIKQLICWLAIDSMHWIVTFQARLRILSWSLILPLIFVHYNFFSRYDNFLIFRPLNEDFQRAETHLDPSFLIDYINFNTDGFIGLLISFKYDFPSFHNVKRLDSFLKYTLREILLFVLTKRSQLYIFSKQYQKFFKTYQCSKVHGTKYATNFFFLNWSNSFILRNVNILFAYAIFRL